MTDPERLSRRSRGLAAELLRASAEERPNEGGVQQTLLALGVSSVVLGGVSAASAAAASGVQLTSAASASAGVGSVGLTTAGTVKAVSATLVVKWLGVGVLGGLGLASVAAVSTRPSPPPIAVRRVATAATPQVSRAAGSAALRSPRSAVVDSRVAPEPAVSLAASAPRVGAVAAAAAEPTPAAGIPLAAEVTYVDQARALLAAGQSSQGLSLLERYEQKFPEARLLPEVLFLRLEAYERSARTAEARGAAERLVSAFPNSPHAGRARRLLGR